MKILIIDDNKAVREALSSLLKKNLESPSITFAATAEEALHLCRKNSYDICFVDYLLDDDDGISLSFMIKKLLPSTSIAIISAAEEPSYLKEKPFSVWINKGEGHGTLLDFIRNIQLQQTISERR